MSAPVPSVSVCLPAYNGARYLARSIGSVLGQTLTDFELVVVDDQSTDATEGIARSFADGRVRYVRNALRLGLVGNWNRCIELARGRYVCLFHQDDVMTPENLIEKVRVLENNAGVGMVHSNAQQIGPDDELIAEGWYSHPAPEEEGVHRGLEYLRRLLSGPNLVCCPSAVVRRDCYERLGGFDGRLPYTADWEMWMRIAAFYDVGYLFRPLVRYRWHEGMESMRFRDARQLEQGYRAKMVLLEKCGHRLPDAASLRTQVMGEYRYLAVEGARRGHRERKLGEAQRYLGLAREIRDDEARSGEGGAGEEEVARWESEVYYRQVIGTFSSAEVARHLSGRTLLAALGVKLARRLGASRLSRLAGRLLRPAPPPTGRGG